MFELMETAGQQAVIKVLGIGGGGGNAVDHMLSANLEGVEFINANTDAQALRRSGVSKVLQLGENLTKGLGAGTDPDVGRQAATEDRDKIAEVLDNTDMVFLTAGMGGGTGTGAAPVIAQLAREKGILTVAIVTRPFKFEGRRRIEAADQGINELSELVDSLIIIPNERILEVMGGQVTLLDAFGKANEVLFNAVQGISELITRPGLINVDFADINTVMRDAGPAWMSIGWGVGENRAREAAQQAITNPLLDVSIESAKGVLFNVTGGSDLKLSELHEAAEVIQRVVDPDANIIFGMVTDPKMENEIKLTIVATGFPTVESMQERENQIQNMLEDVLEGDDIDLDVPPFLRRYSMSRHNNNGSLNK